MSPASSALLSIGLLAALAAPEGVSAHRQQSAERHVTVTFQLHVNGRIPRKMTFWIAYGPLAGRFGIVQLHHVGPHRYAARTMLPAAGRSVFSYIAGYGSMQTRTGRVPGLPTVTIRALGPTTAVTAARVAVRWRTPTG